ncbi:MAG: ParB/RepB/Spo0J family partition protein [candidate division Zixibacteria bacterium]|nr:ParB/RepB/Spo0J family partition protein [candidate division Zixibacteria bacterium]
MKRVALGRGLGALIPPGDAEEKKEISDIAVKHIKSNRNQPRKHFAEDKIIELAESIKHKGFIQPIVVRRNGDNYELIVGERRFRASQYLNLERIPAVIYDEVSNRDVMEMALIENIQRENLNPIEEAGAYQVLLQDYDISQEELAAQVGKDRSSIANSLRLLTLPERIKHMVIDRRLTAGAARVILAVPGEKEKLDLADKIIKEKLSVRELEKLVYGESRKRSARRAVMKSSHLLSIEDRLKSMMQTKVSILPRKKGGRIIIEYYNNDSLTRILEQLKFTEAL